MRNHLAESFYPEKEETIVAHYFLHADFFHFNLLHAQKFYVI